MFLQVYCSSLIFSPYFVLFFFTPRFLFWCVIHTYVFFFGHAALIGQQLHGDAAFAGQGINQEMLMMSGVPHFDVGGTIHMVVNNQVGFTTPGNRGRTTTYCTDLAKMISAPVIHVNGDDPEAVTLATKLAVDYQRIFQRDIFIDLMCFRRWGHNEIDDPTFTNPAIYKIIHSRKSVPDM